MILWSPLIVPHARTGREPNARARALDGAAAPCIGTAIRGAAAHSGSAALSLTRSLSLAAALCLTVAFAADFPGTLKVSFRTSDCDGASGLGSVNVDHITRVQPTGCANGRKLKQVLTRTPNGANEVFTITEDEAVKLEAQIQRIMDARQKALEQTKPVIINR